MEPLLGLVDLTKLNNPGPLHQSGAFINALRGGTWGEVPTTGERLRITHSPLYPIDWVIVGGESGPGARPMHPDWVRGLRDQCQAAGVPFLFKQWGEWVDADNGPDEDAPYKGKADCWVHEDGTTHSGANGVDFFRTYPVYRVGKKAAGRLLDGREWNEAPT